jgi:type II secretion system protein J
LIEVLVAVSLLAIISTLVWQAMGISTASKERFEKRETTFRASTLALDRLSRDLQMAVLFSSADLLGVSAGGEQMTKSVFVGTNNGDQDKLIFNTLSHIRYLKDTKESDLAEVSYFLEPEEEGEGGFFVLKKRVSSPPDAEPEQGGAAFALLEGVKELNFRYYDPRKGEYGDDWDSTKLDFVNRLPRAVEITLAVRDPNDEEETVRFSTVALLEMSPGPNDF